MDPNGALADIDPELIQKNPNNPRRYFNEERLDLLKTSIQEVGVLVPVIVYERPDDPNRYVLMDGERRWRCSLDLALPTLRANVIEAPTPLENLLRMFNIHNVREDWPLISVALSLREVIALSNETGEKRLSEITGLTRATVRRAKRLLSIPDSELELVRNEAHLDRTKQVHREDLYLEIEQAESVLRSKLPEIAAEFTREEVIRKFAAKAERGSLRAVTDFRDVGKLIQAEETQLIDRATVVDAARELINNDAVSPKTVYDDIASFAYRQHTLSRKVQLLRGELEELEAEGSALSSDLRGQLLDLRAIIDGLIGDGL